MAEISEKGLEMLVLQAIISEKFRGALVKDPEAVIKERGYSVTQDELALLKELKPEDWNSITVKELDARIEASSPVSRIPIEPDQPE